jgi:thiamine-phosphate pyrophosphorylase
VHHRILRTIDANINRVSEGLRVLEDVSRFIIEDADLSGRLKSMRHMLNQFARDMGHGLVENRDAAGDIGAGTDLTHVHEDLMSLVRANSKRVQEGLRVLEEMSKLPEVNGSLSAVKLKECRYSVYSIEKSLVNQLSKNNTPGGREKNEKTRKQQ